MGLEGYLNARSYWQAAQLLPDRLVPTPWLRSSKRRAGVALITYAVLPVSACIQWASVIGHLSSVCPLRGIFPHPSPLSFFFINLLNSGNLYIRESYPIATFILVSLRAERLLVSYKLPSFNFMYKNVSIISEFLINCNSLYIKRVTKK